MYIYTHIYRYVLLSVDMTIVASRFLLSLEKLLNDVRFVCDCKKHLLLHVENKIYGPVHLCGTTVSHYTFFGPTFDLHHKIAASAI